MADRHRDIESTEFNNAQLEGRVLPPPYKATGNASIDRLAFFHVLEQLKVSTGRTYGCMEVLLTVTEA